MGPRHALRRRPAGHPSGCPSARRERRSRDGGAAAVEFALVSPLLFMLLFGVVDYGLYMADVLSVQQGASDSAREATLGVGSAADAWPWDDSCAAAPVMPALSASATADLEKVACRLAATVQPIATGPVVVKAEVVDKDGRPSSAWAAGNRLRVCAAAKHDAVLPFVPLPDGGLIRAHADMPVQPGGAALQLNPVAQDASGLGTDWSWC